MGLKFRKTLTLLSLFFVIGGLLGLMFFPGERNVSATDTQTIGTIFTDAIHNHSTYQYKMGYSSSAPDPAHIAFEWTYNSTIHGTISKVELVVMDQGMNTSNSNYDDEVSHFETACSNLNLYINGELIGNVSGYTHYATGDNSGHATYADDDPIIIYWDVNKEVDGNTLLEFDIGYWSTYHDSVFIPVSASDADGDGDTQFENEWGYADGVFTVANDWAGAGSYAVSYWNGTAWIGHPTNEISNSKDPFYQITYSGTTGGIGGTYNETIIANPDSIKQYETSDIMYLFNSTTNINYLTIEHNGSEIYNDTISVLDGNIFFTPDETGTYYINGTRAGSQVAAETLTVTGQTKSYYVYVPVSPVVVGSPFSVYVKYSNSDYDGLFTIENSDGTILSSSAIGKNDSTVHILSKTVSSEGKYYLRLYVNNPYVKTLVAEYVLYAKSSEYVTDITSSTSSVALGNTITLTLTHNAIGSNVYYQIHSDSGGYVVPKTYLTENYQTSVGYTPNQYVGNYQVKLYMYGYLLDQYNFTVTSAGGGETGEEYHLLTPFEALGNVFGVGEDGGKAIAGMLIVVASIGIVYGVDKQNYIRLPTVVYAIVPLLTALVATMLGFFPLWIWIIFAIVIFIYIYNKFLSGGSFRVREE